MPSDIYPQVELFFAGKMNVISEIEDQDVIKKILNHLGVWQVKPRPPPKATAQTRIAEFCIDYSTSQLPRPISGYILEQSIPAKIKNAVQKLIQIKRRKPRKNRALFSDKYIF